VGAGQEDHWLGVDCGSADHPMNTKIRDWEPMEAKMCDEIFKKKYGKSLEEVYPCRSNYQALHIELFCKPLRRSMRSASAAKSKSSQHALRHSHLPLEAGRGRSCISRVVAFDGFDDVYCA
jgi:hypothetical protein